MENTDGSIYSKRNDEESREKYQQIKAKHKNQIMGDERNYLAKTQ